MGHRRGRSSAGREDCAVASAGQRFPSLWPNSPSDTVDRSYRVGRTPLSMIIVAKPSAELDDGVIDRREGKGPNGKRKE